MTHRRCILIVDDDPGIVTLLERALSSQFEIVSASTGLEALEILESPDSHDFDAILADHMMPGLTGIDLLRRALGLAPEAARILVTSSREPQVAHDAINLARAHRLLIKPFGISELSEMVTSAIREVDLERQLRQKNELLNEALGALKENEAHLEREITVRTRALMMANSELASLAMRDGLTNLHNHRYFQDLLRAEVASAVTYERPLSLLFMDVDHFKAYNDSLGHQAGDAILRTIGEILSNTRGHHDPGLAGRSADNVARYGGDEFVLSLPETTKKGALVRAERIRRAVADWDFHERSEDPGRQITVSIGVASVPDDASDREGLIEAADLAMLQAKRLGGNQVQAAGDRSQERAEALSVVGSPHHRRH